MGGLKKQNLLCGKRQLAEKGQCESRMQTLQQGGGCREPGGISSFAVYAERDGVETSRCSPSGWRGFAVCRTEPRAVPQPTGDFAPSRPDLVIG